MDIMELGAIGELVGGVGGAIGGLAVVATLIYLAIQVRQNSETARFSANVTLHSNLNELSPQFVNAENAPALVGGMKSFSGLSADQKQLANVFFYMVTSHGELVLFPDRRTRVDPDLLHRTNVVMAFYFGCPGWREWWFGTEDWPPMREAVSEDFRGYVETLPEREGIVGRLAAANPLLAISGAGGGAS